MPKKIEIAIPKPCHEKWNEFRPTAQGGFCGSCQKEVIDFTSWSEERLMAYFKNKPAHACGRFSDQQLKVYTYEQKRSSVAQWLSAALTGLILMASREGLAQTSKSKTTVEQVQSDFKIEKMAYVPRDSTITIRGRVTYVGDSSGIEGVMVNCNNALQSTLTDLLGRFELTLKKSWTADTIIFSGNGLETIRVFGASDSLQDIHIAMRNVYMFSTVGAVGYLHHRPWYSPRRWWNGVRGWFN